MMKTTSTKHTNVELRAHEINADTASAKREKEQQSLRDSRRESDLVDYNLPFTD